MKEFLSFFTVRFQYEGHTVTRKILLSELQKEPKNYHWQYTWTEILDGNPVEFTLIGVIDDLEEVRTSGECSVAGRTRLPYFLAYRSDIPEKLWDEKNKIDDIDIIDCDAPEPVETRRFKVAVNFPLTLLVEVDAQDEEQALEDAKKIAMNTPYEDWNDDFTSASLEIIKD